MEQSNGVSPVIKVEESYIESNGIGFFNSSDETVTGGSMRNPDGSYFDSYQILWTITRTPDGAGDYIYAGGITAVDNGWYFNNADSPFYGTTIEEIAAQAFDPGPGNLNTFFTNWLANTNSDQKFTFLHETMQNAETCLKYGE